jgi:hypothetical protein
VAYLTGFLPTWTNWPYPESALGDAKKTAALGRLAAELLRLMAWGTGEQKYEVYAQQLNGGSDNNYWLATFAPSAEVRK